MHYHPSFLVLYWALGLQRRPTQYKLDSRYFALRPVMSVYPVSDPTQIDFAYRSF